MTENERNYKLKTVAYKLLSTNVNQDSSVRFCSIRGEKVSNLEENTESYKFMKCIT